MNVKNIRLEISKTCEETANRSTIQWQHPLTHACIDKIIALRSTG